MSPPPALPITVEIVMDAVAMRLLEIVQAAKKISPQSTATKPDIQWSDIVGMRDFLARHYFATNPEIIQLTMEKRLASSVHRLGSALCIQHDRSFRWATSGRPDDTRPQTRPPTCHLTLGWQEWRNVRSPDRGM